MKKYIAILFLLAAGQLWGAEQVDLSAVYVVDPSSSTALKVDALCLDWERSEIYIKLGFGSVKKVFTYSGTTAKNMMITLNKANLTSNSLHKRIFNQLISDGKLSGTVSGNPD